MQKGTQLLAKLHHIIIGNSIAVVQIDQLHDGGRTLEWIKQLYYFAVSLIDQAVKRSMLVMYRGRRRAGASFLGNSWVPLSPVRTQMAMSESNSSAVEVVGWETVGS